MRMLTSGTREINPFRVVCDERSDAEDHVPEMAVKAAQDLGCSHAWTQRFEKLNERGVVKFLLENFECLRV